jgi:thiol:disulfide interchange protein
MELDTPRESVCGAARSGRRIERPDPVSGGTPMSALLLMATLALADGPKPPAARPVIYDEAADAAKQIEEALASARKENKRVLLQFGANWCGWCHKLHKLFHDDPAVSGTLKDGFVVVLIDVNKGHNQETDRRYGNPVRFGLPAIVVLDADGKQLTTKDTNQLEEGDHHSTVKVLAFLKEWSPKK